MIQKIYESYDNSKYYIMCNKKKLAYDNMAVIGVMLTFFVFVSVMFVTVALAFGNGLVPYYKYFPAVLILILLYVIHKIIQAKCALEFEAVRIYALILYAVIIMSFSVADVCIYSESRAVFFPAAILVVSTLYVDTFGIMLLYKIGLSIIFVIADYYFKAGNATVANDITVAFLAIIVSCFCYAAIINATLSSRESNRELVQKSETDLLTGLYNKISFEEKSIMRLDKRMTGEKCTMFIFDLDNFKNVNDSYGHQTGDKVLKLFADILQGYFHPDDIIGRVGGDEFMVLVFGDMPEGFIERRCRSVLHELKTTKIDDISGITCSIGIAEDTQRRDFKELYSMADKALYKAKEGGKAQWRS